MIAFFEFVAKSEMIHAVQVKRESEPEIDFIIAFEQFCKDHHTLRCFLNTKKGDTTTIASP
jgi:hypothetical protein